MLLKMLKRKNIIKRTMIDIPNGEKCKDILKHKVFYGLNFSDLDLKSKDKLIQEICKRILKLELDKQK